MVKVGRPKIEPSKRKVKLIKVRVSVSDHEAIKKFAESRGVSVSDLVKIGLSREGARITLDEVGQHVVEDMVNDNNRDRVNLENKRMRTNPT